MGDRNLSTDIYRTSDGWSAVIYEHPVGGGEGVRIWRKDDMRTQQNAETAMEAAWQRFNSASPERDDSHER